MEMMAATAVQMTRAKLTTVSFLSLGGKTKEEVKHCLRTLPCNPLPLKGEKEMQQSLAYSHLSPLNTRQE